MNNTYVNGKSIWDGLKCPLCDGMLTPESMECGVGGFEYHTERDGFGQMLQTGSPSFDLKMICINCGGRVDIINSHAIIECREPEDRVHRIGWTYRAEEDGYLSRLKRINDIYQFDWEYVIMGVTSVKYGRVRNLGNYETERFEAEVCIEDQTPEEAVAECKSFVKKQLGLGPTDEDLEAARQLLREEGEL